MSLPRTFSQLQLAPTKKNGWLEDDFFLLAHGLFSIFSGYVRIQGCSYSLFYDFFKSFTSQSKPQMTSCHSVLNGGMFLHADTQLISTLTLSDILETSLKPPGLKKTPSARRKTLGPFFFIFALLQTQRLSKVVKASRP